jgi:putative intracellular protease/amidase
MRKIAIMGAGQSGLHLAIRLIRNGYQVTMVSERSAEEIFNGPPTGATYLFHDSLQLERELGLDLWKDSAYHSTGFNVNFGTPDGNYAFSINSRTSKPGASIDQRMKFYQWIKLFEKLGGQFIVSDTTPSDLLACTEQFDLVIVSSGKGPLARLFTLDDERSTHEVPARKLVQLHINNFEHVGKTKFTSISLDAVMGAGEIITAPFYQKDDIQCAFLLVESIPGGPMDVFDGAVSGSELLERTKEMIRTLLPWRYEAFANAEIIADDAYLKGSFTPVVRKPVVHLNSKAAVMGLGDTVILNDPIVGQGGNNASKMANVYAQAIIRHGNVPFDAEWMNRTFEEFWEYSRHVNRFCDIFLSPPAPHVIELLGAASQNPDIASDFVNGFNHPPALFPWLDDEQAARIYMAEKMQAAI